MFFCFKQKTAYDMRISDWSSDVFSSDLLDEAAQLDQVAGPFLASHHPFPAVMAALSGFSSERRLLEFRLRPDDGLHYRRQLCARAAERRQRHRSATPPDFLRPVLRDRKSTRLNSSH